MRPGDLIDIWVVEKALGAGGMGSVYRCHNRSAKRILAAIKVLDAALRRVPGAEERFVREAEILFTLDHPNIVRVRNIRIDSDPPYLEMEFVEGESLDKLLQRGPLPWYRARVVFEQLTDALAYLHARGVRHRDVKPANVLVRADGRTCLVDFGLAMETDQSRLTESNTTFGTVSYAPPEWIDPDAMDPEKWDLYSVGVVAWEILRGQVAFPVSGKGSPRQQAMQVIIAKQNHPALDPGPAFHEDVRALIRELTAPEAQRRPASMASVRDRVRGLDPTTPERPGETLAPAPTPTPARETTLPADAETPAMRSAWARALEQTPIPSQPAARPPGSSEARTLITGPPTRGRAWPTWAAGGLVVLGLGTIGAAVAASLYGGPQETARPIDVVVSGLTSGTPVALAIDGEAPQARISWVWRFARKEPGPHRLAWAIGEGCAGVGCPGQACPAWCGVGENAVEVEKGSGTQSFPLVLTPPPRRAVHVQLPAELALHPVVVKLGDVTRSDPGAEAVFDGVSPGQWDLEVVVGTCPPDTRGCVGIGDCPAGCAASLDEVIVPWGEGDWTLQAVAVAPAAAVAVVRPAPGTAPRSEPIPALPDPAPAPVAVDAAGSAVTVGAFAAWLGSHSEWQRDAAIAANLADKGYLPGWAGAFAPPGAEGQAVRDVSWYAAAAYCKERGGLADLDADPKVWDETIGQPYLEWRVTAGRAAWRSGDGRSSTHQVRMNEANSFTGFRCAR